LREGGKLVFVETLVNLTLFGNLMTILFTVTNSLTRY